MFRWCPARRNILAAPLQSLHLIIDPIRAARQTGAAGKWQAAVPIISCCRRGPARARKPAWTLQDRRQQRHCSRLESGSRLIRVLPLLSVSFRFFVPSPKRTHRCDSFPFPPSSAPPFWRQPRPGRHKPRSPSTPAPGCPVTTTTARRPRRGRNQPATAPAGRCVHGGVPPPAAGTALTSQARAPFASNTTTPPPLLYDHVPHRPPPPPVAPRRSARQGGSRFGRARCDARNQEAVGPEGVDQDQGAGGHEGIGGGGEMWEIGVGGVWMWGGGMGGGEVMGEPPRGGVVGGGGGFEVTRE